MRLFIRRIFMTLFAPIALISILPIIGLCYLFEDNPDYRPTFSWFFQECIKAWKGNQ